MKKIRKNLDENVKVRIPDPNFVEFQVGNGAVAAGHLFGIEVGGFEAEAWKYAADPYLLGDVTSAFYQLFFNFDLRLNVPQVMICMDKQNLYLKLNEFYLSFENDIGFASDKQNAAQLKYGVALFDEEIYIAFWYENKFVCQQNGQIVVKDIKEDENYDCRFRVNYYSEDDSTPSGLVEMKDITFEILNKNGEKLSVSDVNEEMNFAVLQLVE